MNKPCSKLCCNLFKKECHWIKKNTRTVTHWMTALDKYNIKEYMKICTSCKMRLGKGRKTEISNINSKNVSESPGNPMLGCSNDDPEYMDVETGLTLLNAFLTSVGKSPVSNKKHTKSKTYCHKKLEKLAQIKRSLLSSRRHFI